MMRYTTRNEMVEIRLVLHLKDKMTRRHKAYKKTLTESMYEPCECFYLYIRQVLLIQRIYDMHHGELDLRIR